MRTILLLPSSSSSSIRIAGLVFCVCLCTTLAPSSISISKPNCPETCGNITVPYPFGIGSGCSANPYFLVICRNYTSPPTLFLPSINMQVSNISVGGTITVKSPVAPMKCTDVDKTEPIGKSFLGSPFTVAAYRNLFVVLSCTNSVLLRINETVVSGCTPTCLRDYQYESCNGINCCRTDIPPRSRRLKYTYRSVTQGGNSGRCGYAFPVDKKWFRKGNELFKSLWNNASNPLDEQPVYAPLVLDWELVGAKISSYAQCTDPHDSGTYYSPPDFMCSSPYISSYQYATKQCSCRDGFQGNPYLDEGCVDIDECKGSNDCNGGTCINEVGSYTCQARDLGTRPRVRNILFISIGSTLLGAGIFVPCLSKMVVKRFKARQRRKFFISNGGLLLEQKLSSTNNGYKKPKLFSSMELAQATDHYNKNRILGCGGQGTVYKGMLTDGSIVAVKKSKNVSGSDIEVFINEVVILSQIIHRNIVKLLGCCLEREVPLLVYEFIPNGTLFQHIHEPNEDFPLTWEMRLRIAVEIAGALSYLHSSASTPIFHRDIKSTNILLDEKYHAKISDFGTSRAVAIDQTHFTTRVFGTFGYLDPEYYQLNRFTEKSDVYSFGVVMVELLTGEKAISSLRSETGRSLAAYFLHSMEEDKLFDIVDARIQEDGKGQEEIVAMAELSGRCLHLNGRLRPTMRQVANELESIIQIKKSSDNQNHDCDGVSDPVEPKESHDFSSIISLTLER